MYTTGVEELASRMTTRRMRTDTGKVTYLNPQDLPCKNLKINLKHYILMCKYTSIFGGTSRCLCGPDEVGAPKHDRSGRPIFDRGSIGSPSGGMVEVQKRGYSRRVVPGGTGDLNWGEWG